jgi:hypothetical protein
MDWSVPNLLYQFSETIDIHPEVFKAKGWVFVVHKLALQK